MSAKAPARLSGLVLLLTASAIATALPPDQALPSADGPASDASATMVVRPLLLQTQDAPAEPNAQTAPPAPSRWQSRDPDVAGPRQPRVVVVRPRSAFGGYWNGYWGGHYDPYGALVPSHPGYERYWSDYWAEEAIRADRARRRFNAQDMDRRAERLLSAHEKALRQGQELLRAGNYSRAIIALTLAAELNHADPLCRLHLAQARVAQGHYEDAAAVLRRALDLQPKLVYLDLRLASFYPREEDWAAFTEALGAEIASRGKRASGELHFLLGYYEFQRGDFDRANASFQHAARRLGNDDLTREFAKLTKPRR